MGNFRKLPQWENAEGNKIGIVLSREQGLHISAITMRLGDKHLDELKGDDRAVTFPKNQMDFKHTDLGIIN